MQSSYTTYEAAKADLLGEGFIRTISCVDGAELFVKEDGDVYPNRAIVRIQQHWVAPQWGDSRNYFTVNFI